MKWIGLLILAAGCSESGAHFTLSAPNGPTTAASFRVILATPDQIPSIANQRVTPASLETQAVPYFLQRTVAGADAQPIDQVDGLAVKIEPDPTVGGSEFIPFVLLYDTHGAIVGVGTFHAEGQTMPSPVIVLPDEIDKYTLDVEPVMQVDDQTRAAAGQVQVVVCYDDMQSPLTSGFAWRPAGGGELRVLFPIDGGLDATGRDLDLDCDSHPVTVENSGPDCDDTRNWFNRDAIETCDGYDTNCDGLSNIVVACTANVGGQVCPDPTTGMGLTLCDDRTGQVGQCQSDPQCLCATDPTNCTRCVLDWQLGTTASSLVPCQPGLGQMSTSGLCETGPCIVQVLAVYGGWSAEVAASTSNLAFGSKATGVGSSFLIRARRPEGPGTEIPGVKGQSTGEIDLSITGPDGSVHLRAVDLRIALDAATNCSGSGPFSMSCTP
ncbi:MAG TPA: putative metal-binding motif-containing protein [Kofleriaceae bacterium]|nr:putative metal-binding motif-containing protein [Kofleriaceae bacterium]